MQALQLGPDFLAGLNIVFSGVAALVALLLLWFTVVKGPSLELVSDFTATPLEKPPNTMLQLDTMVGLDRIEIRPIGLVFVNDGSHFRLKDSQNIRERKWVQKEGLNVKK